MLATKVATAAAAITLTVGGAAAAGALPDAAQDGVAEAGTHIGLNLPDTAADEAREATSADAEAEAGAETETEEVEVKEVETDDVETDETHELGNVTNDTDADAHGEDVSAIATDDSLTGAEKGAAVSATAKGEAGTDVEGGPEAESTDDGDDDGDDTDDTDDADDTEDDESSAGGGNAAVDVEARGQG